MARAVDTIDQGRMEEIAEEAQDRAFRIMNDVAFIEGRPERDHNAQYVDSFRQLLERECGVERPRGWPDV